MASDVRRIFEMETNAFNAHDVSAFADNTAEDVTTRAPGVGELTGKQAVTAFYRSWLDAFPDARVEVGAVHFLDDRAVEEGVFIGTHRATLRGPAGELPATGRSVRVEYIQVLRFRGDKVASFHLVFDRVEMLEQLGVMPTAEQERASWQGDTTEAAHPH
jgi:predicted ester cyclase